MKKVLESISRIIRNRYILLGTRLILGTIFILAAAGKIPEPARFVDVVTGYGLLPWDLARAYGTVLPWLELALGICLVMGFLARLVAGVSILMILSFIVANGTAVYSYGYSRDPCGCFGGSIFGLMKISDALIMDTVMIVIAFVILLYGGGRWSLYSLILTKIKKPTPQKRYIDDGLSGKEAGARSGG